ncbi:uncharacterized protein LOC144650037 isoform X2 [Oculina patagonica]
MKVEEAQKFPITSKEPPQFEENQKQDKANKPEPGLSEEQVETLKQVSSLVAMFQQEALNEKQTRLLAQLKALEKDRLASDAWKIIAALKKEKGDLETQVQKLKAQNSKLASERVGPVGGCKRSQVKPSETRQTEVKLPDTVNDTNRIKDELNKLFVKNTVAPTVREKKGDLNDKQTKPKNVPDTTASVSSNIDESAQVTDTRTQDVTSKNNLAGKSPVQIEEFRDPVAGVCGLENLGNTCFVNAGLQCLFSVTPFCRFFLGGGHKTVTQKNLKNSQQLLCKSLGDLVTKVWSGSYLQCDPTELYSAITTHFYSQLTPQRQHDCHEFLALFLDGLHQELNCAHSDSSSADQPNKSDCAEQKWRQYTRCNDSLIVDTFQGQLQSKITCCNCGHESFKHQPFTFLSVPLLSESYHTFVVTWMSRDSKQTSDGKIQAVRFKVQVTKPSTVLKLKNNFVSLLADYERPQLKEIKVSVVRNSQIISIMSDDKQLTPFTDRRSKLYIFKPSQAPESLYVKDDVNMRRSSLLCPAGRVSSQANDSTMYYSPEAASTSEFMSALDELQTEPAAVGKSPVNKRHINRLASPNTSTPKTQAGQRTHASLSNVYRLSGTCCICLEEKSDKELIPHDKCGRLFCRRCLQDAAGGVIEYQLSCPRCAKQEAVIQTHEMEHKSRMIIIPVVLRRFEEDSKTKRLFGHPYLIILPTNILGKDVYSFIAKLLPEPVSSLPFTLHLVDQQGLHCSRCTKITGCTGCQVNNNVILNLQSCDNLAVHLTSISRWEAERMSRCVEHDSMWKPRNTEDPLQLQKCLKTFVESEELPDTWYCQKCREERDASKCLSLCRLPDTLIIHLKRYSQSGVKITAPVEFPVEELDMRQYTKLEHYSAEEIGAGELIYDLIGCVCHEGSYSSGHYTAYTNNNGVWYRYDDSHVTKEMPSNKCYAQAYILFYRRRAVSSLSTSTSDTQETIEDKCMPLSEETESTEIEADEPSPKLPQLSFTKEKTFKEIGEELTQKLTALQTAADRVCQNNTASNGPTMNQVKRRKWKTKQKMPGKLRATEEPSKLTARPEGICEEGKVNTCDCKQCEYLKTLEKQIKKAKHFTDKQSALRDVLDTVKKNNMTRKHCRDSSSSVSKKSSLTSVSLSIHSSVSPSTTQSCTTVSSEDPGCYLPKDTAVQVTICDHQENQSPNTKQRHKKYSGDDSSLDDVGTLSQKLKYAIENENIRRAVTLLRRGADPNILVNGLSALHTAVGLDSPLTLRFTRLLLDYGGDPDIPSVDGLTPIHLAAMWNRVNCLKLLIDRGGNPYRQDNEGMNALKLAKVFESDTSADTSDFLGKLDDRISKQLQESSFQSISLDSHSGDELSPPFQSSYPPSPRAGCGMKRLGKRVSMRMVGRRVSRNFRRASGQFRRGIRQIRSLLSSSSSDKQIKD